MNPFDLLQVTGDRFSMVSLFPAVLVVLDVFALILSGAFHGEPDIGKLIQEMEHLKIGPAFLLALSVLILALLLQPFQLQMVRLLEGYWGTSPLAKLATEIVTQPRRHRFATHVERSKKWRHLDLPDPAAGQRIDDQHQALREFRKKQRLKDRADAVRRRYPRAVERVLPTALGNALRSFEDTAGQRYGLDTISAFRHLHPLMSAPLEKTYSAYRRQLDSAANLCVTFAVITVVSISALAGDGWWQAVPVATALLAWITYRGAITSALLMGHVVTTAFDLHRHDLVRAMHYAPAPDPALEYAFNTRLSRWLQADDLDQRPAPESMEDDYNHSAALLNSAPAENEPSDGT